MEAVSLSQIAKKVRTSKATVSRAFNFADGISEGTRNAVFKAAAEMGYVHNVEKSRHAKMLNPCSVSEPVLRKRTGVVTLLHYRSSRQLIYAVPYYQDLTHHLEATLRSEGMSIMESYPQNETEYLRIVDSSSSDAILVIANIQELHGDFINRLNLHASRQPLIFLSNYPRGFQGKFHSVRADDIGVGFTAADYCCRTGSEPVLFVDSGFGMEVVEERYLGYRRALENHDRAPVRIPFQDDSWNLRGVSGLEGGFSLPQGRVSFIGAADSTVFFFVDYLKKTGQFDSSRMRFVGMDGIPPLTADDVRTATVRVDLEAMARETWHLLNDALNGKIMKPKSIQVGCELMVKNATVL